MTAVMRIDDIRLGERVRKDMGDLQTLADSMKDIGLLQPIGVSSKGELVYGQRRLEAAQSLGWSEIAVVIIDLSNPLQAEHDENVERKDFTMSEKVAIARKIQDRAKALNRLNAARLKGHPKGTKLADLGVKSLPGGVARETAAAAVGISAPTLQRAQVVVEAAEDDPALQPIVDAMDSGELPVSAAHREVTQPKKPGVVTKPVGALKRSHRSATERLKKVADQLANYAAALPSMDTRGEDVEDVLRQVAANARAVANAANRLAKEAAA